MRKNPEAFAETLKAGKARPRLLVRFPNWVGDAVMALPALEALRRSLPEARIAVLAKPWVADIAAMSGNTDGLILYQERDRGFRGNLGLASRIRAGRFDGAVLLQNAIEAVLLAVIGGVPLRGGFDTDGRGFLLTHRVPRERKGGEGHQVGYYLKAVRALGFTAEVPEIPHLEPLPAEGVEKGSVVLAPGASFGPAKMWPWENFAELGRRLSGRGHPVLVLGSGAEARVCGKVAAGIPGAMDLSGKTGLRDAAGILAASALAVCNDSGLMHLSAAVGIPLVALFGSTDSSATGPVSPKAVVLQGKAPCAPCFRRTCERKMECFGDLTPERLERACLEAMGEPR